MTTLQQFRQGLERAWDSFTEGWRLLHDRAAQALTRFSPVHHGDDIQTTDEQQLMQHASRWGLLTAEMQETDDGYVVRIEVPGMKDEDFDIDIVDDILVVRGEKRARREGRQGRYHFMECAYGRFERAIPLPAPVDADGTRARYRGGVLSVTLPRAAHARRRQINVESA